ncbi:hypothetical protein C8R43DRAFT_1141977 [Mycena crocata]|nr:hypothetical protein C8R43DRAFT_1141977 [Mycena crocata]
MAKRAKIAYRPPSRKKLLWRQRVREAHRNAAFVALLAANDIQQEAQAWSDHSSDGWGPIPSEPYDWAAATNNGQGWGPSGWGKGTTGRWGTGGWGPDDPWRAPRGWGTDTEESDAAIDAELAKPVWNSGGWAEGGTLDFDNHSPDSWARSLRAASPSNS